MSEVQPPVLEKNDRHIALWLLVCCALIFSMVVLGGVTRLTRSGLSMVHWKPISGVVPPLSTAQWQEEFNHYKNYPEYKKSNLGMSLHEFKSIFWFEYSHRLLGRIIGLVFLIPFLYFLFRKRIKPNLLPKLVMMFFLGGLQGLLGWYMVKSGLVDRPHVSQYRLTSHLLAALLIYGFIFWVAMDLLRPKTKIGQNTPESARLKKIGIAFTTLVVLMITTGGFVAGTKAGFAFNTFPFMNGKIVPDGIFSMQPFYINFFENIAAVQFNHRLFALLVVSLFVYLLFNSRRVNLNNRTRLSIHYVEGMLAIQIILGITTLLYVVPVPLAACHQAGALMLLTTSLYMNHNLRNLGTAQKSPHKV